MRRAVTVFRHRTRLRMSLVERTASTTSSVIFDGQMEFFPGSDPIEWPDLSEATPIEP